VFLKLRHLEPQINPGGVSPGELLRAIARLRDSGQRQGLGWVAHLANGTPLEVGELSGVVHRTEETNKKGFNLAANSYHGAPMH